MQNRSSIAVLLALLAAVALAACGGKSGDDTTTSSGSDQIKIGALLDISDGWTTLGKSSEATLTVAAADANRELAKGGSKQRVKLTTIDVKGDPDAALAGIEKLHDQGVRIVIGPQASSEVAQVRDYADSNGMVVISQGSTAHSLSIAGDNVFRFVPDDRREAQALVALLERDRIDTLVPIWRDDPGNAGLHESVDKAFTAAGGKVTKGVEYKQDQKDFKTPLDELSSQVASASGKTGVYLAAFDEVVQLFDQARKDSELAKTPWYGSDGVALSEPLIEDKTAAAFAVEVGYPNPTLGLDPRLLPRSVGVRNEVGNQTGREPDAFALSGYDALRVATDAYVKAGGTGDLASYKQDLVAIADRHQGITGSTALNANGDRAFGSFDFWSVCPKGNDTYAWKTTAKYVATGNSGHLIDATTCK